MRCRYTALNGDGGQHHNLTTPRTVRILWFNTYGVGRFGGITVTRNTSRIITSVTGRWNYNTAGAGLVQ